MPTFEWDPDKNKKNLSKQEGVQNNLKPVTLEITTNDLEVDTWLSENRERLSEVIKPIIKSLFEAEKMIKE